MCSGGDDGKAKRKAEKKQRQLNKDAERKQRRLDQLAAERTALAAQQRERQAQLQIQASEARAAQGAQVERLKYEQSQRLKALGAENRVKRREIEQQTAKQVAGIERAGGAAATSLRILGQVQPMAPTAVQTPKKDRTRGASSTAANVARGSASTRGTNLSI